MEVLALSLLSTFPTINSGGWEEVKMKKKLINVALPIIGSLSVLIFCVTAAASIADPPFITSQPFSEPINMILLGLGMIGFGKAMR
jgi:hypothetical protein